MYTLGFFVSTTPIVWYSWLSDKTNIFKFSYILIENLETFLKDPEAYIPEYGGYCAYAIALKNKKVKIDPETFEIRDNKLYLFYNAWGTNTLELWLENDVKGLQEKGDKNWEAMNF